MKKINYILGVLIISIGLMACGSNDTPDKEAEIIEELELEDIK